MSNSNGSRSICFTVKQSLYKENHPDILVWSLNEQELTVSQVADFIRDTSFVGLAGAYKSGQLVQLALSTSKEVLLIRLKPFSKIEQGQKQAPLGKLVLSSDHVQKIAFNLDRLALALHYDINLKITNSIDLLTLSEKNDCRTSLRSVFSALGDRDKLLIPKATDVFQSEREDSKRKDLVVLRAWATYQVAQSEKMAERNHGIPKIDTSIFNKSHLDLLAAFAGAFYQLEALKPTVRKNDISTEMVMKKGKLEVTATRFKTRFRISASQTLRLETNNKSSEGHKGRVTNVRGRSTTISPNKPINHTAIRAITTIGKEDPTSAETCKIDIILKTLQGRVRLFKNPIVNKVWFCDHIRSNLRVDGTMPSRFDGQAGARSLSKLNPSQKLAVQAMLRPCSESDPVQVTVIQGPPGSGKTSVAAGFVQAVQGLPVVEYGEAVYLIAQSNVAVKNMAEKLAKVGFNKWRLIVSRDFHFDWHEHLYKKMVKNIIESPHLPGNILETERVFRGTRVILCTLSMLSNKQLGHLTRLFPPRSLVVDEASQIEVGDYLPPFHVFQKTLRRLCFIGDDKQLAPYGQDDIPNLQSIFEVQNLRNEVTFLDTQYRMPKPIGDFISHAVYNGRLKSSHSIDSRLSCRFVDVNRGVEMKDGHGWKNVREVQIIVHLVRHATRAEEDFRVITPYDAQRNELEAALKQARLPWEDRCFNVDSFQGNQADLILVSLVRTKKPGFLNNERRMNVLLTRCKKQMTICSNRCFLEGEARATLAGRMAARWLESNIDWISMDDVINRRL